MRRIILDIPTLIIIIVFASELAGVSYVIVVVDDGGSDGRRIGHLVGLSVIHSIKTSAFLVA
ncbi:hypothetical protein MYCTH_2129515 [Thermothelomyces thermophilus ATCC 42464]|uniref:Uncharacterized protein n=1 Tax=Thermothelomyces thermophilus (strain ATCC 42464 / BCRC 31852 / DSM 1799) TaxID=573729 RepID=G2QIZ5_THET4|nr:uncharacterized protein MYCTH_2129515 [Thermothelomyces thermophilus ATCC 42464]AEO60414.1 hypothetical protein MYCTH_2129515 [Thermothelomyces thermophilus ATCC 42464]